MQTMNAHCTGPCAVNEAKRFLLEYRDIEGNALAHLRKYELCARNLDRVCELFERATRATSSMTATRMSGTPMHDGMANAVLEMVRLKDYATEHLGGYDGKLDFLLEDLARLADAGRERLELIARLKSEQQKRLLFLRYICGMRWESMAREMGYSVDNLYKLHGRALAEANRIYRMNPVKVKSVQ